MAFSRRVSSIMTKMNCILHPLRMSTSIPYADGNYCNTTYNWNNYNTNTRNTNNNTHEAIQHHSKHKHCNASWTHKSNFDSSNGWNDFVSNCEEEEEEDFDLDFLLGNVSKETHVEKLCKDVENTCVLYFCFEFFQMLLLLCRACFVLLLFEIVRVAKNDILMEKMNVIVQVHQENEDD